MWLTYDMMQGQHKELNIFIKKKIIKCLSSHVFIKCLSKFKFLLLIEFNSAFLALILSLASRETLVNCRFIFILYIAIFTDLGIHDFQRHRVSCSHLLLVKNKQNYLSVFQVFCPQPDHNQLILICSMLVSLNVSVNFSLSADRSLMENLTYK